MSETPDRNRLGEETSPYLLQHKDNPVHWWPWGPGALAAAKASNKPILLSVGYAACHWCHVMAHESFEDPETAKVMNDNFINIKVDREERPDIDAIYMSALLRLSDTGGWPLTMFLDAEARPFWGGTYFPPEEKFGRPSFRHVLGELARIYREEPDKVSHNAARITEAIATRPEDRSVFPVNEGVLNDLVDKTVDTMDPEHGGMKGAPKFPQWGIFWFLWRTGIAFDNAPARQATKIFLTHVCQGGIYDHLGGGFARYSVDERWLVPHFEKMLYDNALLIDLMTEVWRETQDPLLETRIAETVDWLAGEMIADGGAFAASLDADSEGEEGKFYVWSKQEVLDTLGADDGQYFCGVYDITKQGNFEGRNIPNRLGTLDLRSPDDEARLTDLRTKLRAARDSRVRPGWDDKVLADWNGLMIAALARAAFVFQRDDWREMAERAFAFVQSRMIVENRLMHSYRAGEVRAPATSADYANMIRAALRLYETNGDKSILAQAEAWTEIINCHYWISGPDGYATTADDTEDVIVRLVNAHDDATPNANAIMTANLVDLFLLTGNERSLDRARRTVEAFAGDLTERLFGHFGLLASYLSLLRPQHVTIAATDNAETTVALTNSLRTISLPGAVCQVTKNTDSLAGEKAPVDGKPAAYICIGPQCSPPVTEPSKLEDELCSARRIGA